MRILWSITDLPANVAAMEYDPRNRKRLQQRGHDVVGLPINPTAAGSTVHIFNCRVEGSFHQQMGSARPRVSPLWCHQFGFHWHVPSGAAEAALAC